MNLWKDGWKTWFTSTAQSDCRYTKAVDNKVRGGSPPDGRCGQWRWFWGRSEQNRPNEHACKRYEHDVKQFGKCGGSLGGQRHNNKHFATTSCKLTRSSFRPCVGSMKPVAHYHTCMHKRNKHVNGCNGTNVMRNNKEFYAVTVAGTSIRGAECKLQAGYHMSVCKDCNCKSLINFKTFVEPAAGNPAGCVSWMLRASNFVETYFAASRRQPQMLRKQFKCRKQKAKSKKQKQEEECQEEEEYQEEEECQEEECQEELVTMEGDG